MLLTFIVLRKLQIKRTNRSRFEIVLISFAIHRFFHKKKGNMNATLDITTPQWPYKCDNNTENNFNVTTQRKRKAYRYEIVVNAQHAYRLKGAVRGLRNYYRILQSG